MRRSAEHKEIELFVHLDSFLLSLPFKFMYTLRVENKNGIPLKLQNSKSWAALLREKYMKTAKKGGDCIRWKRKHMCLHIKRWKSGW